MEISKMTKKKRKEFYAKNRVTFGMNTGTITHKGYKDTLRRENKIYYHWSAYTSSALKEAKKIIDVITTDKFETEISAEEKECKLLFLREFSLIPLAAAKEDIRLRILRYLENTGGGIDGGCDSTEFQYIKELYPDIKFKPFNISRNKGLFVCSKDAMDDLQSWSEGDIIIDLDENITNNAKVIIPGKALNDVNSLLSSEEEVKEYYNIRGNIPFINDLELSCIPFNKIDSVLERVVEMEEISDYVFKNALNKYIAFIA